MKCLWKGSARDGGQRTSTRPASRLAFTLIELLVVIAVIAILASLLLSAINRAKVQARIAGCKSNLHQYGLGLRMYLDDYKGYPLDTTVTPTNFVAWFSSCSPTQRTPGRAAWVRTGGPRSRSRPASRFALTTAGWGPVLLRSSGVLRRRQLRIQFLRLRLRLRQRTRVWLGRAERALPLPQRRL